MKVIKYSFLVVFAVCLFLLGGMRVSAEESETYSCGSIIGNDDYGLDEQINTFTISDSNVGLVGFSDYNYSDASIATISVVFYAIDNGTVYSSVPSSVSIFGTYRHTSPSGSISENTSVGSVYCSRQDSYPLISFFCEFPLFSSYDAVLSYIKTGDDSGQINKPETPLPTWDKAWYNSSFGLKDFSVTRDEYWITALWSGFEHANKGLEVALNTQFELTYVRVEFGYCHNGYLGQGVTIKEWDKVYSAGSGGCEIPYEDIAPDDGDFLFFIRCTPYYFENDDPLGKLHIGRVAYVYWDENGVQSIAQNKTPGDAFNPASDGNADFSIWDTITNFFGDFFRNFGNALKDLFVPDGEFFSEYFTNLNDFFSEKLGMLYAPIDIFIDLLTAFLNASPSTSTIHFPGFQWDGVWVLPKTDVSVNEFWSQFPDIQDKLYFVTDIIMVGSVLWLLQNKYREVFAK